MENWKPNRTPFFETNYTASRQVFSMENNTSCWKLGGVRYKNGAIIVFKDIDEAKAKQLMETLPLYKLKKSVEYFALIKQF